MQVDTGVIHQQAKECQRLAGNDQLLENGHGTGFFLTPSEGQTLPTHCSQTSSLQNCERINVCCLSHPVCGTLSQRTDTLSEHSLWETMAWPMDFAHPRPPSMSVTQSLYFPSSVSRLTKLQIITILPPSPSQGKDGLIVSRKYASPDGFRSLSSGH